MWKFLPPPPPLVPLYTPNVPRVALLYILLTFQKKKKIMWKFCEAYKQLKMKSVKNQKTGLIIHNKMATEDVSIKTRFWQRKWNVLS
jgi:hypothetical protein